MSSAAARVELELGPRPPEVGRLGAERAAGSSFGPRKRKRWNELKVEVESKRRGQQQQVLAAAATAAASCLWALVQIWLTTSLASGQLAIDRQIPATDWPLPASGSSELSFEFLGLGQLPAGQQLCLFEGQLNSV